MKIVLLEEIKKLGQPGDVVVVKDGYARNFLIPAGKALKADSPAIKLWESQRRVAETKTTRALNTYQTLADRIERIELIARVQVGEEERMFGAVTSSDIAQLLTKKGIEIDRRIIDLPEPIKALGSYRVPVRLHAKVVAQLKVTVIPEE